MEYEISPEPTLEERRALIAALELSTGDDTTWESAWWRAGVTESTDSE